MTERNLLNVSDSAVELTFHALENDYYFPTTTERQQRRPAEKKSSAPPIVRGAELPVGVVER